MSRRFDRRTMVAGAAALTLASRYVPLTAASNTGGLEIPDTPLGRQIAWALGLLTGKSTGLTEADIKAHMAPSAYAQTGIAGLIALFDQASTTLGPIKAIGFAEPPNSTGTFAVVEFEAKTGGHYGMVIMTTGAPDNLITIFTLKTMAATATPAASTAIPDTPVGAQLAWLLGLLTGSPIQLPDAEFAAHFDAAYLKAVGPSELNDAFNQLSIGSGPFVLDSFSEPATDSSAKAVIVGKDGVKYLLSIEVGADAKRLITGLLINVAPVMDAYDSWDAFDADLQSMARYSSFVVVEVAGAGNSLVAGVSETDISAIGSAFKIYVLGALALAVENGSASWDEKLAIRDDWKSLPSGDFQNEPAGTEFTLRQFAEKMISISDNTAADHLLLRLGRSNVETATVEMGMANPNHNLPFLTTRELFALKLFADDATVREYLDARGYGRLALLPAIDALPLDKSKAASWTSPRYIEQIEWFASVNDLANATQWLLAKSEEPALSPLREILSLNPGVQLDPKVWTYVAFKGGSEVGVLTTTWYLTAASKRSYVVSGALNDPARPIDEKTAIEAMTKAINLLGKTA
jgi:beta-lactamase class A